MDPWVDNKSRSGKPKEVKNIFLALIVGSSLLAPVAHADEELKKFLRTCTYGVIAGGLVGAASLAFSEDPGSNLNPIARGASLGLYGGIAVGLIGMNPESQEDALFFVIPKNDSLLLGVNFFSF